MSLAHALKLIVALLAAVASTCVALRQPGTETTSERASGELSGRSIQQLRNRIRATAAPRIVAVAIVVVAVLISRTVSAFTAPQLVVEDAGVFWLSQYTKGFWASLFESYAGYLHVIPRLIAGIADRFPYAWAPTVYVWSAAVITGWTGGTIASLQLTRAMSAMLAVSIVLVAHGGEVWSTATNLQWVMATALPLVAVTDSPESPIARTNIFVFVVLASLSGPFSVLMMPMWIYRLVRGSRRTSDDAALCLAALLCGLFTLSVLMLHLGATPNGDSRFVEALRVSFVRSFAEVFLEIGNKVIRNVATAKLAVFMCVFLPLAGSCFMGWHRNVRVACLYFSFVVAAATAWHWRIGGAFLDDYYANERYFYVPMVMLAFCAVTLLFEKTRLLKLTGVCLVTAMAVPTVNRFERAPAVDFSKEWADKSKQIGNQPVEIEYYPGWRMTVPQRRATQR
jgi:hypothetical protein